MERNYLRKKFPTLSPLNFDKIMMMLEESGEETLADTFRHGGTRAVPAIIKSLSNENKGKLASSIQETISGQRSLLRYCYKLTPKEFLLLVLSIIEGASIRKFDIKSTAVQKTMCILKGIFESIVPFDDFAAYEYGPFSVELDHAEGQIRKSGLIGYSEKGELIVTRTGRTVALLAHEKLDAAKVAELESTIFELARMTPLELKRKAQQEFIKKWPNVADTYVFPQIFFCSVFRKQIRLPDTYREILPILKGLENVSQINLGLRRKLLFGYSVWAHTFDVYCSTEFLEMGLNENDKSHLKIAALLHDSLKRFNPAFEPVINKAVGLSHEEAVKPFLRRHFGSTICSNYSVEVISDIITGKRKPHGSLLNSDILDLDQITYTLELSYLLSDRTFDRKTAQNLIKNLSLRNGEVCVQQEHLRLCEKWYQAYIDGYVRAYLSREAIADTAILRQALYLAYLHKLLPVPKGVDDLYRLNDYKILDSLRSIESTTHEGKIIRSLMAAYDHDRRFGIVEVKQKISQKELDETIIELSRKLNVEIEYIMTFPLAEAKMLSPIPVISDRNQIVDAAQLSWRIRESRNLARSKLRDVVYFVVPWKIKDQIRFLIRRT